MTPRWLTGWVTPPSRWVDGAIVAALAAAVIFIVVMMLGWR
jgi:hypothetical protein